MCPYICGAEACDCVCEVSTARQRCTVACGTCYAPWYVMAFGEPPANGTAVETTRCNRDDVGCVHRFFSGIDMGTIIDGYTSRGQWARGQLPSFDLGYDIIYYVMAPILSLFCIAYVSGRLWDKASEAREAAEAPPQA